MEDEAIREAVRMQEAVGLESATDGELRRGSWHMDFIYQLGGVKKLESDLVVEFKNRSGNISFTPASMRVDEPVRLDHTIFADDFTFVRDAVSTAVPKLTIPSPSMVHYRGGRAAIDETIYPDLEDFWSDLTAAYREEIGRLGDLGCTYLQLDDTSLAYLNDPTQREHIGNLGGDPEHQHEAYIRYLNDAIASRPDGMRDHDAHVPWQLPLVVVSPRATTATSPRCCSTSSPSTASSWNGTTSAPAASSRCASCRPARSWCSAW